MSTFMPRELYGVIGWPLAQTLSPLIHNTGFQALEIPAVYMAWPLAPESLDCFARAMGILKIRGCSVTIPHKIAIMPYLDSISGQAALAGAVNTLFWRDGQLCGENTDIAGFLAPLADIALADRRVLLLGAGGAAHAVCAALKSRGCRDVFIASPGNRRQFELAAGFGFTPLKWADRHVVKANLIINATPLGMKGENQDATAYDFSLNPPEAGCLAYDLVYNPRETVFLRQAASAGCQCVSGVEMFLGQADAQFRLWTGRSLPGQARAIIMENLR